MNRKGKKRSGLPSRSGFYQPGTFQRQMYRMPDMCRPLSEPGLAPDRIGIRFGLYVETTSGLYQQLLQLRVHSLFRCMPYRCDQPLTNRREDNDTGRIATFFKGRCVVNTEEKDCGACAEPLPDPGRTHGSLQRNTDDPADQPDLCIGCGGCESICPVRPMRAIIVKSNVEHKFVEKPKEEESKKIEVDDFGF